MKKTMALLLAAVCVPMLWGFRSGRHVQYAAQDNLLTNQAQQHTHVKLIKTKNSKTMIIEKQIVINSGIEACWQVLGVDFAHADRWASAVSHSEGKGTGFNGASCSERSCSTTMGGLKEKLLEFSPQTHTLKYEVAEGMPSMVKYATNTWQLSEQGNGQTRLTMQTEMQIGGLMGTLMKPMMRAKMSKLTGQIGEEFKFYIENRQPHPRKLKALRKAS